MLHSQQKKETLVADIWNTFRYYFARHTNTQHSWMGVDVSTHALIQSLMQNFSNEKLMLQAMIDEFFFIYFLYQFIIFFINTWV